jgi:hypothetical protein
MTGATNACNPVPADVTAVSASSGTTYPANVDCGVAVTANPPAGNVTTLQFSAMDMQANVDMVWVHDGTDATAPVVAVFSAATSFYSGTSGNTLFPFSAVVRLLMAMPRCAAHVGQPPLPSRCSASLLHSAQSFC